MMFSFFEFIMGRLYLIGKWNNLMTKSKGQSTACLCSIVLIWSTGNETFLGYNFRARHAGNIFLMLNINCLKYLSILIFLPIIVSHFAGMKQKTLCSFVNCIPQSHFCTKLEAKKLDKSGQKWLKNLTATVFLETCHGISAMSGNNLTSC